MIVTDYMSHCYKLKDVQLESLEVTGLGEGNNFV